MNVDPFADLYPEWSAYNYALDNPANIVDARGDSINVRNIQAYDERNYTSVLATVITQLNRITGLTFSVNANGNLVYETDKNGKPVVAQDAKGKDVGSKTARNVMMQGVSDVRSVKAYVDCCNASKPYSFASPDPKANEFNINIYQIQQFESGVNGGLDPLTMGYGMSFIHEFSHTQVGGSLQDITTSFDPVGSAETRVDRIRRELGPSFGQRQQYGAVDLKKGWLYLPFDGNAMAALSFGVAPSQGSKFIKCRSCAH